MIVDGAPLTWKDDHSGWSPTTTGCSEYLEQIAFAHHLPDLVLQGQLADLVLGVPESSIVLGGGPLAFEAFLTTDEEVVSAGGRRWASTHTSWITATNFSPRRRRSTASSSCSLTPVRPVVSRSGCPPSVSHLGDRRRTLRVENPFPSGRAPRQQDPLSSARWRRCASVWRHDATRTLTKAACSYWLQGTRKRVNSPATDTGRLSHTSRTGSQQAAAVRGGP